MFDAEERFDSFLNRIKDLIQEPDESWDREIEREVMEENSYLKSLDDIEYYHWEIFRSQRISCFNADLHIKIMESGIFHKGGLKGTNLDLNARDFEVHTIDDLEDLLLEVASNLETFSAVKDIQARECWIRELFESLEKNFNQLLPTIKLYKGGRAAQKLERKRKEMLKLQEDILQRPSRTPKPSDIKKHIAIIFRKYVKAPKVIIAERVSDLLNFFGIDAKPESVREKLKNK
jgi:hypothetical protein